MASPARAEIRAANNLAAAGDHDGALRLLDGLDAEGRADATARYVRAVVLRRRAGGLPEATDLFRGLAAGACAAASAGDRARAQAQLAKCHADALRNLDATGSADAAGGLAASFEALAVAAEADGAAGVARDALHRAGVASSRRGDWARARESLSAAAARGPGDAALQHNLGECARELGDYDAAAASCVEISHWFGGSPPNFRTLYLSLIHI